MNLKKYQTAGKKKKVTPNKEITKDLQSINVVPKDEEWKDGKIVKLVVTGDNTKRVQIGVYYTDAKGNKVRGLKPVKGTIPRHKNKKVYKKQTGGLRRYEHGGWHAPDEIFPGQEPEFQVKFGQGAPGSDFGWGLSSGTYKYLGNEAYKFGAGAAKKWGEELEDFGQAAYQKGKSWVGERFKEDGGVRQYQKGGITRNVSTDMFDPNLNINLLNLYNKGSGYGGNINPRLSIGPDRNMSFHHKSGDSALDGQSRLTLGPNLSTSMINYNDPRDPQYGGYGDQNRTTLGGRMSFQSPIGNKGLIGGLSGEAGGVLSGSNNRVPLTSLGNDAGYAQAQAGLGYYPKNSNLGIKGNIGYGTEGSTMPGLSYGLTGNYGPATFNVGKDRLGVNAGFGLSLPLGTRRKQTGGMYGANTMSAAGQGTGPQLGISSTMIGQETDPQLQQARLQSLAESGQGLTTESSALRQQTEKQAAIDEQMAEQKGIQASADYNRAADAIQGTVGKAATTLGGELYPGQGGLAPAVGGAVEAYNLTRGANLLAKGAKLSQAGSALAPGVSGAATVAAAKGAELTAKGSQLAFQGVPYALPTAANTAANTGSALGAGLGKFATSGAGIGLIASGVGMGVSALSDDDDPTHSNVGEYTGSILSSAGTGASIGSFFPGPGTAIGAGIGALWGAGQQFFGTKKASKAQGEWENEQALKRSEGIYDLNQRTSKLYGSHMANVRAGNLAQKTVSGQNLGRNVMYKNGGFMMGMPRYGYNY